MIKIRITNMSCGHCRLKINAELEEAGFMNNEFEMDHDTINIDATLKDLNKAYEAIKKVGYTIDKDFSPIISGKITLKVLNLSEKSILDKAIEVLFDLDVVYIDFDLDTSEIYINCDANLIEKIKIKFELDKITLENVLIT